ncbi:MAG TPA: helix-turn-helix domain-containing protein [Actinomycetales bacterium]|nr:helix-turn-helix domain-containing protein [Actinomycetales bacterium]
MGLNSQQRPSDPLYSNGSDRYHLLAAKSRRAVLEVLRRSDDALDAAQVAAEVDRHVSTVRQHLEALARGGVVSRRVERRTIRGRPRVLYAATSRREPDDGDGLLAMMLASHLAHGDDPSAQAEDAGRRWGLALTAASTARAADAPAPDQASVVPDVVATQRIIDLLGEVGFEPQARATRHGTEIDLHRCPFEQVARSHPEVACSVHLGLMRGALEALGSPVRADRLEPFVTPQLCRAHLQHT